MSPATMTPASPLAAEVLSELRWLETQRAEGDRIRAENRALDEAYEEALAMEEGGAA